MNNKKKSLDEKIVHSVFLYETKKTTLETIGKIGILFMSFITIIVFGGVILDIYTENELSDLFRGFIANGEYSYLKLKELGDVIVNEIPLWITVSCIFGIALGCILIVSIIKNWSTIVHKTRSLAHYWFSL
jgi:hypothetical protein